MSSGGGGPCGGPPRPAALGAVADPPALRTPHAPKHRRLVAVLERRAFVYDLQSLQLLGTLDTPPNPAGLAALTAGPGGACLLALPAGGGAVRVYDCGRGGTGGGGGGGGGVDALCELQAHKQPLVGALWVGRSGGLPACWAGLQACVLVAG